MEKGRDGETVYMQIDYRILKKDVNMNFFGEDCIIAIKILKRGIFGKYPLLYGWNCHNKSIFFG